MDRAIVFWVLLLVGLTWLLYKLTILLEPPSNGSASGPHGHGASATSGASNNGKRSQQLIHQRLRK